MALIRPEIYSPETLTLDSIIHELNLALTNLLPPISEIDKLDISKVIRKAVNHPYPIGNLLLHITWHPALNSPNLSKSIFRLLSPMHAAALLGDIALMQNWIDKGYSINNRVNEWQVSPLEVALQCNYIEVIDFLLTKLAATDLQQSLKCAVVYNSFAIINKLLDHAALITDEIISLGRTRDSRLGLFLELKRKQKYILLARAHSPLKALNEILADEKDPDQPLIDFFRVYPKVMNTIENVADGNTFLHKLVASKELNKIKILLIAIFHAQYCDIEGFQFDIEQKNKAGKTVLDLALANGNNDITSAVILYGAPKTAGYETLLIKTEINLHAIYQEREKLIREALQEQARLLQRTVAATIDTTHDVMALAEDHTRFEQLTQALQQQMLLNRFLIMEMYSHNHMPLPDLPDLDSLSLGEPARARVTATVENRFGLFARPRLAPLADELSPADQLREMKDELGIIKSEIQAKLSRIDQLEEKISLLERQVQGTFSHH